MSWVKIMFCKISNRKGSMSKINKIILNSVMSLALLTSVFYACIRLFTIFTNTYTSGDEGGFLHVFNIFIESGFYEANVYGNSTVFNGISYLFYLVGFDRLMSLRITNLFSAISSIYLLWFFIIRNFNHLSRLYRNAIMITSVNAMIVVSFIFSGINDTFITFFTILFFIILYKIKGNKGKKNLLYFFFIGGVFALILSTRKMGVLLFPTFIFVLILYFYNQKFGFKIIMNRVSIIAVSFLLGLLLFNYPSLKENGKLSFHEKKIETEGVSWPQLQYLTAIWLEEGKVEYGKHCKPKDVIAYISKNGNKSLPNSVLETMTFNIGRSFKTSTREAIYLIKPYTRILGLVFVFGLFFFLIGVFKKEITLKKIINNGIAVFFINYNIIIVLIICSYVEPRWFLPIIVLIPIMFFSYFFNLKDKGKIGGKFEFLTLGVHFLLLGLMNVKFIMNNYQFIF